MIKQAIIIKGESGCLGVILPDNSPAEAERAEEIIGAAVKLAPHPGLVLGLLLEAFTPSDGYERIDVKIVDTTSSKD